VAAAGFCKCFCKAADLKLLQTERPGKLVGIAEVIRYHATGFFMGGSVPVSPGKGRQTETKDTWE
jgi:hypothetical protein